MKKLIRSLIITVSLILGVLFIFLGFKEFFYSLDSKYKNEAIRSVVVKESTSKNPLDRSIDFEKLKKENEDIVAWIYIPGTTVDYPILIGNSDEEYLYKDVEGNYNPLGSIFSFSNTKKDFSESHIKLFGHNMREFQMFGELRKYLNTDYMEEHKKFYIYTDKKSMECDIVSIFVCDETDSLFWNVGTGADFLISLANRNVNSSYDLPSKINELSDNQVYTLVTCNGVEGTTERLVVNGIAIKEKIKL